MRHLGAVQMDPTNAVARTEHLVLFSRLGRRYRREELARLLWEERSLFEYRAYIVPTSDFGVHRETMRRYPSGTDARRAYVRRYLRENAAFRRHVLARLRTDGPLRTRDLEDRSAVGWRTGGWNDDGRNTGMMLEVLWSKGEVMIVGRDGQQRVWDLGERRLPVEEPRLPARAVARRILEGQLRAKGVAPISRFGFVAGERPPGWERALADLLREEIVVPVRVGDLKGAWYAYAGALDDASFRPRTVLLSPFDQLIHDRDRTEALFGFHYRLEIYVPPAKREYGYFVLPILDGDRLVGRLDPRFDRESGVLRIDGVWAEQGAPTSAGPRVAGAMRELADWLGAREITFGPVMPSAWRTALRA